MPRYSKGPISETGGVHVPVCHLLSLRKSRSAHNNHAAPAALPAHLQRAVLTLWSEAIQALLEHDFHKIPMDCFRLFFGALILFCKGAKS